MAWVLGWFRGIVAIGCIGAAVVGAVGCGGGDDAEADAGDSTLSERLGGVLSEEELTELRALEALGEAGASEEVLRPSMETDAEAASDPPVAPPVVSASVPDSALSVASPMVFVEHRITDPEYNGMVASTMLYPEGWAVEGGLTRTAVGYYNVPLLVDLKFTAPDGRQAHIFPTLSFEFNQQAQGTQLFAPTANGNMYYPLPESPGRWIMDLAKQNPDPTVSNLRLVSEEPDPDLTRRLQQQSAPMYQMIRDGKHLAMQTGVDMAFDTQATVVTLRYTQNGIDLEESVLIAWNYFLNLWNGQVTGGTWGITTMVSLRGPVGSDYMTDPQLMAIFHSIRPNPQWVQKQQAYWQELARIRQRGQAQRNRDWQAHNAKMQQIRQETSDIIAQGYANRVAVNDRMNEKFIDTIHDVTQYNTPDGGTVKLPSFYDNVHTDGHGRYLLTNDLSYDPNGDLNQTGSWTRIEPSP
ncbi:MAG: hypothetical protein AAFX76_11490 [Planctomycetota bacterium]